MRFAFDMDGTLADNSAREHLAKAAAGEMGPGKQAAWDLFHEGIPNDKPIEAVRRVLKALYFDRHTVEIWTARPEKYRPVTLLWMAKHAIPPSLTLRMRKDGDFRPATQVKLEWYRAHPVDMVFEDHSGTVAALRALGCVVAQVGVQS